MVSPRRPHFAISPMSSFCQRHSRLSIAILVLVLVTLFFVGPQYNSISPFGGLYRPYFMMNDDQLSTRVDRAELIYHSLLDDRQNLIKKFGPTPKELVMFPPDHDPWPPYTVWDFFPPAFNCPHEMERLGELGDGGKWVCGASRVADKPDCVIYSVGINNESSFEEALLSRTRHCEVWGYDFSVNSFGPQISHPHRSRTHFQPWGLAGKDVHGPEHEYPMYTLQSLMAINGHKHIDILKIDIESWEFETLRTLVTSYVAAGRPLPFGQLQLEIHLWQKSFEDFLQWWELLETAGLRPFMTEPNLVYQNYNKENGKAELAEYSFLNIKGNNIFVSNPKPDARYIRHASKDT